MSLYPKIQSPCPYKGQLSAILDGDQCRLCKRQVFNLDAMSDGDRAAFLEGCSGEVCVTYRLPARLAAAAFAAAVIATPMAAAASDTTSQIVVVTGGITDHANRQFVQNPGDSAIPELPVVYDDTQNTNGK